MLTVEEEAVVVAFRRHTLLPPEACVKLASYARAVDAISEARFAVATMTKRSNQPLVVSFRALSS